MAVSTRTDEAIQADVLDELRWDTRVQPNEVGVAVKDGIVTLTGWVDSYLKKIVAEEAAHRVRGVKAVVNDIEVRLPGSAERTDADLAKAVLNALQWEADIPAGKLDVTVSKGWVEVQGNKVILRGTVRAYAEKKAAEETAWAAPGVTEVENRIVISPPL